MLFIQTMVISDQEWTAFMENRRKRKKVAHPSIIPVVAAFSSHIAALGVHVLSSGKSKVDKPKKEVEADDDVEYVDAETGQIISRSELNDTMELVPGEYSP